MPIYWTNKSIPELAALSKEERQRIVNITRWKAFRHWQFWITSVIFFFWVWFLLEIAVPFVGESLGRVVRAVVAVLGGGIGGLFLNQVAIKLKRPHMRAALQSQQTASDVDS